MTPIDQDPSARLAALLHRCTALWRVQLDERLRPWGMTQTSWRTLWLLRTASERYNQCTLAERLGIETPTLARVVERMERLGLLCRTSDQRDRRQKHVEITERGRQLAAEIEVEVLAVRARMLAGLDAAELGAGIALCEKILGNTSPGPNTEERQGAEIRNGRQAAPISKGKSAD